MAKFLYCVLFLLCCLSRSTTTATGNEEKTLNRQKRWLWGGCGLIPYCDKCLNSHVCIKCETGYMFIEYGNRASVKTIQCSKTCPKGYKIKNKTKIGPTCIYTDKVCQVPHCNVCHPRRTNSCNKCSRGFYRLKPSVTDNARCVRKCPRWCSATIQRDGTKECILNATECRVQVPNCDRCLDKIWCRRCQPGYLTYFNSVNLTMDCVKTCPPKYKQVKSEYFGQYCEKRRDSKKCKTIPHCNYCPNKSSCKKCSKRYLKHKSSLKDDDTQCVRVCPKGFRRKAKRCVPLKKRGLCQGDYCMICSKGFTRAKRGLCLRRCPKGYYTVGTVPKFCLKCPAGCNKCIHTNKCFRCKNGYSKLKNKEGTYCVRSCPSGYKTKRHRKQNTCQPIKVT